MADEKQKPKESNDEPSVNKKSLKSTIMTIVIVAGVMFLEAGAIVGTMWLSGPKQVEARGIDSDLEAVQNRLVELTLVQTKFDNKSTGRTYLYDTEIFVTVKKKHQKQVEEEITGSQAQIDTEIATIFRRGEPAHFREPTLATLTRQIKAALDDRFGRDEQDESIIADVLIRKCIEMPIY